MNSEDCERARRLRNTIFSCGNDLSAESAQWLRDHNAACASCREKFDSSQRSIAKTPVH